MALSNTNAVDYVLYSANDHHGRVPWLDGPDRATTVANILNVLGVSP